MAGPISMLEIACSAQHSSIEIVRKILKEGHPTKEQLSKSLISASYREADIVDELLTAGADPNFVAKNLDTPLSVAILADQEDVAIRLVEAGAATNQAQRNKDSDYWKKSLAEVAKLKGMKRLLEKIQGSADGNAATTKSKSPAKRKPKSIEECWAVIDEWMARNAADTQLPPGFDFKSLSSDALPNAVELLCKRRLQSQSVFR